MSNIFGGLDGIRGRLKSILVFVVVMNIFPHIDLFKCEMNIK